VVARIEAPDFRLSPEEQLRLFQAYRRPLRAYFQRARRRNTVDNADDLLQLTFLALQRSQPREPIRDPRAYLFGIAHHVQQHSDRRSKRHHNRFVSLEQMLPEAGDGNATLEGYRPDGDYDTTVVAWQPRPPAVSWETNTSGEILRAQIAHAIKSLPPVWQACFIWSYRDQYARKEIAQKLGISENTVKKYLKLTLAHLRNHMNANTMDDGCAVKDRS